MHNFRYRADNCVGSHRLITCASSAWWKEWSDMMGILILRRVLPVELVNHLLMKKQIRLTSRKYYIYYIYSLIYMRPIMRNTSIRFAFLPCIMNKTKLLTKLLHIWYIADLRFAMDINNVFWNLCILKPSYYPLNHNNITRGWYFSEYIHSNIYI